MSRVTAAFTAVTYIYLVIGEMIQYSIEFYTSNPNIPLRSYTCQFYTEYYKSCERCVYSKLVFLPTKYTYIQWKSNQNKIICINMQIACKQFLFNLNSFKLYFQNLLKIIFKKMLLPYLN